MSACKPVVRVMPETQPHAAHARHGHTPVAECCCCCEHHCLQGSVAVMKTTACRLLRKLPMSKSVHVLLRCARVQCALHWLLAPSSEATGSAAGTEAIQNAPHLLTFFEFLLLFALPSAPTEQRAHGTLMAGGHAHLLIGTCSFVVPHGRGQLDACQMQPNAAAGALEAGMATTGVSVRGAQACARCQLSSADTRAMLTEARSGRTSQHQGPTCVSAALGALPPFNSRAQGQRRRALGTSRHNSTQFCGCTLTTRHQSVAEFDWPLFACRRLGRLVGMGK